MHEAESPRVDDAGMERRLEQSPAPRVTLADVHANIVGEFFFTAADAYRFGWLVAEHPAGVREDVHRVAHSIPMRSYGGLCADIDANASTPQALRLLTFCVLLLRNGFTVVGTSACVSPENFDPQIGRDIARRNAVDQIWPFLGYELASRLHDEPRKYTAAVDPAHGNDKAAVCVASQDANGDTIVHSIHHPEG